ncbi:FtsX-like permease family protein [Lachnospiraceae bacterium OttesenSCG-928-D06]|nr:FtsX-like permease family protein [Lachnospiraceae bacterium OttesenSCG-928-D06]
MKSMMSRTTIREIKQSMGRYMAIFAIVALGVGFFSGLKVTKSTMLSSAQDYMEDLAFYDYRLLSTLGFDVDDEDDIAKEEGVLAAEGALSFDILCLDEEENTRVLKAHSLTENVNRVALISGRMPENAGECVADSELYSEADIGTTIVLSIDNEEDDLENFTYREYMITGIVNSPAYIHYDRGTSSLGNGKVSGFFYIPKEGFDVDYYTEIYIKFDENFPLYSAEYKDFIASKELQWEEIGTRQANARYDKILNDAWEEIKDGEAELLEKKEEAEIELSDAEAELLDAAKEIADGEEKLADGEKEIAKAEKEIRDGEKDLLEAQETLQSEEQTLRDSEYELKDAEIAWNNGNETFQAAKKNLNESQEKLDGERNALIEQENQLNQSKKQLDEQEAQLNAAIEAGYMQENDAAVIQARAEIAGGRAVIAEYASQIEEGFRTIESYQQEINVGRVSLGEAEKEITSSWQQIQDGYKEIADGWKQIEEAKVEIEEGLQEIEDAKVSLAKAKQELPEKKQELLDGKEEYEEGKQEYEDALAEFNQEIADAEQEIADAKEELNDLEEPDVYVLGRDTNGGYVYFENDSDIVEGIANIFPVFFFLVAALVCITTMNRMVEEQRTQIGVLKALGYGESAIMWKYIFYSGSGAVLGCVFGFFLGTLVFPVVIWSAYGMMYTMGKVSYIFDGGLALISLAVSLLCSIGTTWISCRYEMKTVAADLMRPKAPKVGKRVFLEYIPFVWKPMKFLHKVSIRNLFRYKRRFFMMIIGIGGCTALLVTGLGIRDSIANVAIQQFNEIQIYDIAANFKEEENTALTELLNETIEPYGGSYTYVYEKAQDLYFEGNMKSVDVVIIKDKEEIADYIDLHTINGNQIPYPGTGQGVITHKIAKKYNITLGDVILLRDENMQEIEVTICGISENFVYDYIYLQESTYVEQMGELPEYKSAFFNFSEDADLHTAGASVMKLTEVASITINKDIEKHITEMMISLNYIVLLVIACAAGLAFIVLYNLTNINITERIREIATIKVLGFYKKESEAYVFRENIILSVLGALVGLILGTWLHRFVMNEINIDMIAFDIRISLLSYLMSFMLTMIFTWCINRMMSVKLEHINMAESLKSVD